MSEFTKRVLKMVDEFNALMKEHGDKVDVWVEKDGKRTHFRDVEKIDIEPGQKIGFDLKEVPGGASPKIHFIRVEAALGRANSAVSAM